MATHRVKFSQRQTLAYQTLERPEVKCLLYGGAKGGGKSVFGCFWMYMQCLKLIEKFNILPQKYPIVVGYLGRKRGVDFTDTTLETWKRFIPVEDYVIRSQEKEIVINERVKLAYGGFDDEANIKKFNSAEFGFYFIDQAEEVTRDDIGLLRGTLRLKIKDTQLGYKGLLSANPADCWLRDEFIDVQSDRYAFIQALPSDNPYLPEDYVDNLKEAFKHRPELVKAYVYGSWNILAGGNLVLHPIWIKEAIQRNINNILEEVTIGCDPARYGDDETVIYAVKGGQLIDEDIYGQKDTMETAGRCTKMKNIHNAKLIVVDATGLGAGVVDKLAELRQPVKEVNFACKATTEDKETKYFNLRAEVYWEVAEMFGDLRVSIPNDPVLRKQLSHITYKIGSRGRIQIESKDEIKKRLSGQSPDRADALVLGLWGQGQVATHKYDFKRVDLDLKDRLMNAQTHGELNPLYAESLAQLMPAEQKSDYDY